MTPSPAARAAADRLATPVLEIGRFWMVGPDAAARADDLGLDGPLGFWVQGRAGVLGEVDADLAAAAIGFCDPGFVRNKWTTRPDGWTVADSTDAYAAVAATWGAERFADVGTAELDRIDELATRVVAGADASTGMLFSGWRARALPDDPAGRVTVRLNVLRELRGGAHLSAVHAVGLGPLGAILATDDPVRGGPAGAERFGWSGPFEAPDRDARVRAEEVTGHIAAAALAVLDDAEAAELADLVVALRERCG